MRFAFIVNNYPPRVGGVESHVHSLVQHLVARGDDAVVITLSESAGLEREDGIDVIRLREHLRVADVLGFPAPGTARRIARILRERNVDVVSIHTRFFPMSWVGLRSARRAGLPVIHTEHGSDHVVSDSLLIRAASRFVDFTVGRAILRQADDVVGVSERVTAFVHRLSGRRAEVFYNAIDASASDAPEEGVVKSPGPHDVVFVGRLVPGKGADVFVDAIALLTARGLDVRGEILGDGVERDGIRRAVADRGLQDVVRMRGRVPSEEVRAALRRAVLVNPTTLAEGFQTTLLEALDEGGAVVTFDVPGAALLSEQGHPVTIVGEQTAQAVADATEAMLHRGWEVRPLRGWHWEERAAEYAERAESLVARNVSGRHG